MAHEPGHGQVMAILLEVWYPIIRLLSIFELFSENDKAHIVYYSAIKSAMTVVQTFEREEESKSDYDFNDFSADDDQY